MTTVRTELAADLPHVMGDRVQVQEVMMNLIMNSVDTMKEVDGIRTLVITSRSTNADKAQPFSSVFQRQSRPAHDVHRRAGQRWPQAPH